MLRHLCHASYLTAALKVLAQQAQLLCCSAELPCIKACLPLVLQDLVQPQLSYKDRKIAQQQQRDQVVRLTNAEVRRCPLSDTSKPGFELHR